MKNKTIKKETRILFTCVQTAFIFFALLAAGCGDKQPREAKAATAAPSGDDVNTIECKGTIEAEHHFTRYLLQGEKISALKVTEGKQVKKGDLLAEVSNYAALKEYADLSYRKLQFADKQNSIKILELEIAKTTGAVSDLEKELKTEKEMGKKVAEYPLEIQSRRMKKELERLKEELNIMTKKRDFLQTSVKEEGKIISFLDSQLSQVNRRMQAMEIRAPFAGVVVYVPFSIESLRPGDLVVEILDDRKMFVSAYVWQHQLQYIKPGAPVKIYPDFFGESFFKGHVERIRPSPVKSARDEYPKFPVYIAVDQGIKEFKVGMSVTIRIMGNNVPPEKK
jgi:multidrug efflux pump subunit AcrA (membrane-fusion protein)